MAFEPVLYRTKLKALRRVYRLILVANLLVQFANARESLFERVVGFILTSIGGDLAPIEDDGRLTGKDLVEVIAFLNTVKPMVGIQIVQFRFVSPVTLSARIRYIILV